MIIISGSAVVSGYRAINECAGGEYMTSTASLTKNKNSNFLLKIRFTGKFLTPLRRKICYHYLLFFFLERGDFVQDALVFNF